MAIGPGLQPGTKASNERFGFERKRDACRARPAGAGCTARAFIRRRERQGVRNTAEHYRKQAEDCLLQAEKSKHLDHKASWLKLSKQWLEMAEEADKTDRSRSVIRRTEKR